MNGAGTRQVEMSLNTRSGEEKKARLSLKKWLALPVPELTWAESPIFSTQKHNAWAHGDT
jgi:hypothetical protein